MNWNDLKKNDNNWKSQIVPVETQSIKLHWVFKYFRKSIWSVLIATFRYVKETRSSSKIQPLDYEKNDSLTLKNIL